MVFFPKGKYPIKVDDFGHLQQFLLLWGHRRKYFHICVIIVVIKLYIFTSRTIFILKSSNDVQMLMEISATYPIPLLAAVKTTFLLWHRRRVHYIFHTITTEFWDLDVVDAALQTRIHRRAKFINWFLLCHCSAAMLYVCFHLLFPYVPIPEGRTKWLPTLIVFPYDQDKSPLHEILLITMAFDMYMSVLGNAFYDFLFIYAAQHLCIQFMLLRELLRNLNVGVGGADDLSKFQSRDYQNVIYRRLEVCVQHHNILLQFGAELKKLTSGLFGLQLITTFTTLVLVGYMITEDLEQLSKSAVLLSFVVSTTVELSIFAVQSTEINSQSSTVAIAAYQCKWHLLNARSKRALTLIIMNAQEGIQILGADLIPINNQIIVEMGQKVFSCITLLRSLQE